jgi:hypothetical protein
MFNIKVTEFLHKVNYYQHLREDTALSSHNVLFAYGWLRMSGEATCFCVVITQNWDNHKSSVVSNHYTWSEATDGMHGLLSIDRISFRTQEAVFHTKRRNIFRYCQVNNERTECNCTYTLGFIFLQAISVQLLLFWPIKIWYS